MKRLTLLPAFILVGIMLSSPAANAVQTPSYDGYFPPVVLQESGPIVDPNSPRIPSVLPLSCSFDNLTGNLHFDFLFPMGDVTITLTEAIAGVVSTDEYSTSSCSVVVPVPSQGTYEVSIVLESGTEYEGHFIY